MYVVEPFRMTVNVDEWGFNMAVNFRLLTRDTVSCQLTNFFSDAVPYEFVGQ